MKDTAGEKSSVNPEASPVQLATAWLDRRSVAVFNQIKRTERSISFELAYKPKPPGAMPPEYLGSGRDEEDWKIAQLEHLQAPQEIEVAIEHHRDQLESLYSQLGEVNEEKDLIKQGDQSVIDKYSGLEKERLAREAEKQRLDEEKKRSREFEAISEFQSSLSELATYLRSNKVEQYRHGPNGWQLSWFNRADEWNSEDLWDFDHLAEGEKGKRKDTGVRLFADPNNSGFRIEIDDRTQVHEVPGFYNKTKKAFMHPRLSFSIREGKLYTPTNIEVIEDYQWGYPDEHVNGSTLLTNFSQVDFDKVRALMSPLLSDIKNLPK